MPIGSRPHLAVIGPLGAALALIAALSVAPGSAAGIEAHALLPSIGFEGWFHNGAWTPVRVDVQTGNEAFDGHLVLGVPRGTLRSLPPAYVEVRLPIKQEAHSHTLHRLTLPLVGSPHPLTFQLQSRSGLIVTSVRVNLLDKATSLPIVLVLDPQAQSWAWLAADSDTSTPTFAYATDAADLPDEALGLYSVTAVWVSPEFPLHTLSPLQEEALQEYVEHGGHLVFMGGAHTPTFSDNWADWLGAPLPSMVHHIRTPDGVDVPAWRLPGTETTETEVPMLHQSYRQGAGRLTLIAANPLHLESMRPRTAWRDLLGLVESVHVPHDTMANDEAFWRILNGATLSSGLPWRIVALLIGHVVLVVFLAHRAERGPLSLALLPIVVGVGTYVIGYQTAAMGLPDRVNYAEIRLTHHVAEGVVSSRTYGLLDSHQARATDIRVGAANTLPFPAPHNTTVDLATRYTGDRIVLTDTPVRLLHEAREAAQVRLRTTGEQTVNVLNDGDVPLRHAFLISADQYVNLGTVSARGERSVTLIGQASSGRIAETIEAVLERLPTARRPHPLEIKSLGAAIGWALNVYSLQSPPVSWFLVAVADGDAAIEIPPTSQHRRVNVLVLPVPPLVLQGGDPS